MRQTVDLNCNQSIPEILLSNQVMESFPGEIKLTNILLLDLPWYLYLSSIISDQQDKDGTISRFPIRVITLS
jgi:hypothetical protein